MFQASKYTKINSESIWTIEACTVIGKDLHSLNLTNSNVSYVPELRCNLLPVAGLMGNAVASG